VSAIRIGRLLLSTVALGLLVGCSTSESPQPVRGQILSSNRPLVEALVVFHPQFAVPAGQPKPLGITDAEGRFQLTTLGSNDGAFPGSYRITVEQRQERLSGEEIVRDGPNLLPARYAKSQSTPFEFTVTSGENTVSPLNIEP